jgi:hypothetical protein
MLLTTRGAGGAGKVLAYDSFSRTGLELTGSGWTSASMSNAPASRFNPALAGLPNGDVLLFGGMDATTSALLNDTWLLSGTTWAQVTTGHDAVRSSSRRRAPPATTSDVRGWTGPPCLVNSGSSWRCAAQLDRPAGRMLGAIVHRPTLARRQ